MKNYTMAIILLAASATASAFDPTPINVPSDPKAKYTILDVQGPPEKRIVTSRRQGPSGESFAVRQYDCLARSFKYIAEGETVEDLKKSKPDSSMSPLTAGSVTTFIGAYACSI